MNRVCKCGARVRNTNPRVVKCELCYRSERDSKRKMSEPDFYTTQERERSIAGFSGDWTHGYQRDKYLPE